MTTDERPERTQDESGHAKRRTHLLNVLGVVFFGAAALVFGVVWKSMEPADVDPMSEARCRADKEMGGQPARKARDGTIDLEVLEYLLKWDRKAAEYYPYYAAKLALAQGRQREAATKAMLVPAAVGVVCLVLGYVSFRARLITAGILLMGLTAVYAAFLIAKKDVGEAEAAMYGFVIAVAGLSGLVCAALGMMRILAARKGT
jgi:hypothetical protein